MEKILADNGNKVDVVLAQNDGIVGAVIEALAAQGLSVPVGGQDGDPAALNRVERHHARGSLRRGRSRGPGLLI